MFTMNTFAKGTKFNFVDAIAYADSGIVSKQVVKNEKGNVTLFAFAQGESLSEHTAPFDAMVQVIDGEATIVIDGKNHLLETGESIIMPAHMSHAVLATKAFKMVLTMIKA